MGSPPFFALTSLNPGDVIHGCLHSPGSCYRIADVLWGRFQIETFKNSEENPEIRTGEWHAAEKKTHESSSKCYNGGP